MKAIQTRYLGPTNHRPARIRAWAEGCAAITFAYDDEWSLEENHQAAAFLFAKSKSWPQPIGGSLPNGDFAWVSNR